MIFRFNMLCSNEMSPSQDNLSLRRKRRKRNASDEDLEDELAKRRLISPLRNLSLSPITKSEKKTPKDSFRRQG